MHMGQAALEALNDIATMVDDSPIGKLAVRRCGNTNSKGDWEALDEAGGAKETAAQTAARLQQQSADTRSAVL